MEPWQSWAIVLLGGGAAWLYYASRQTGKKAGQRPHTANSGAGSKLDTRSMRLRDDNQGRRRVSKFTRGSESADTASSVIDHPGQARPVKAREERVKKTKKSSAPGADIDDMHERTEPQRAHQGAREKEVDDQAFAKQMLEVKAGQDLKPSGRGGPRPGSVASRANHAGMSRGLSTASSTTGADADDDLSPAHSPALVATTAPDDQYVSGTNVSDMLDAPAPSAPVLRITPSTAYGTGPASTKQSVKPAAIPETKKQRQNRRKAEENKAAREVAEVERRALLEKQLRTAREAEGRPAKNGLGGPTTTWSSKPVKPSPWNTASNVAAASHQTDSHQNVLGQQPLLETFDPNQSPSQEPQAGAEHPGRANAGSTGTSIDSNGTRTSSIWDREIPSEEDQMRMLQEMEGGAGWNTVPKGRRGKRTKTGPESSESEDPNGRGPGGATASGSDDGANIPVSAATTATTTTTSKARQPGIVAKSASDVMNGSVRPAHPADSDWAVL